MNKRGAFLRGATLSMTAIVVAAIAAPALRAQDQGANMPRIENARLEQRAVSGSLAAEVEKEAARSPQPRWIGYAVPKVASDHKVCCDNYGSWRNGGCGTCRLEDGNREVKVTSEDSSSAHQGTMKLEGATTVAVLLRADGQRIMKVRPLSGECAVDAGGLPVVWLTGVKLAESVALLAQYVRQSDFEEHDGGHGLGQGALAAIALHSDEAADRALASFVQPDQRESLRKQAAFWLGAARGKAGFLALQQMAKSDPSSDVRAHVTFALSISPEPGATEEMIRVAREDESGHVRGQALFWIAQKAGKRAASTITGAINNDPDTEVKKRAVFALSQLPKDEGVPRLIEVAQTNRNPEVRKQAMFWLGQSNDPRALAFFEKVLSQ